MTSLDLPAESRWKLGKTPSPKILLKPIEPLVLAVVRETLDQLFMFIIPALLFGAMGWLFMLARAYVRSRMLPMCWRCGAWKVNPSSTLCRLDLLPLLTLLIPVRCGGCLRRYYGVRGIKAQTARPAWQTENRALRYVDQSSTTLALIYAFFAPPGQRPKIRVRVKLPLMARPAVVPMVHSEPEASGSIELPVHEQQLANLLQALVADGEPVSPNVPVHIPHKRRRRRKKAHAASS